MTDIASVLEVNKVGNLCRRRCDNVGVYVEFIEGLQTAETDGKNIRIPALLQPVSKEQLEVTYGFVVHECGHHTRPEAFDILKGAKPGAALAGIYNVVEDDGMERAVAERYRGDAAALGRSNKIIMDKIVKNFKEEFAKYEGKELDPEKLAPILALLMGQFSRTTWDGDSLGALHELFKDIHPDIKKHTTDLLNEGWHDKLSETQTPFETWDVACDLFKRLYNLSDEEQEQLEQARANGHAGGNGEDVPNPAAQASEVGGGDNEEGIAAKGESAIVSWKDVQISEHADWKPKQGPAGSVGIDWRGYTGSEGVGLMPTEMINVIDLKGRKHSSYVNPNDYLANHTDSKALGNKLRRYLQSQAKVRHDPEKLHGRLDKSALVRLALPPIDGGEWNKKIFHDYRFATTKDTAIMVMVDWSGSMSGHKMSYAADAAGRLILVCDRVLKMPVSVAAFSNGYSFCDVGIVKKFTERSVDPNELARRFAAFVDYSSANNDADAVNWGYHQLLQRKESRKLLLVLSDGCPAGEWQGHGHFNLEYLASQIHNNPAVELYGIGICSDAVEAYYPNHKVLNSESEISKTLFDIIKEGDYNAKRNRQRH